MNKQLGKQNLKHLLCTHSPPLQFPIPLPVLLRPEGCRNMAGCGAPRGSCPLPPLHRGLCAGRSSLRSSPPVPYGRESLRTPPAALPSELARHFLTLVPSTLPTRQRLPFFSRGWTPHAQCPRLRGWAVPHCEAVGAVKAGWNWLGRDWGRQDLTCLASGKSRSQTLRAAPEQRLPVQQKPVHDRIIINNDKDMLNLQLLKRRVPSLLFCLYS